MAWEVYHQSRLEGVGPLIFELRNLALTEFEAEDLAHKLDVIGTVYAEIEADEIKAAQDEAKITRRQRRGGT